MRFLVVVALVLGCKGKDAPKAPPTGAGSSAPVGAPGAGRITEADARAFAERLATDVIPCDPAKLATRIAGDALAGRLFCEWMGGIASYKVVGVRTVGGAVHPVMRRLINDPGGSGAMFVNYDELALARRGDDLQLADAMSFRQGVWLSELVATNADTKTTDFLGASSKHAEVRAARDLLRTGDRAATLKAIDALPADVRKERGVQLLRVRAAVGQPGYKQALDELAQTFPDDPSIALTAVDGALDLSNYDGALHWIDVLEGSIGIDAYLESTRVIALVRKGDLDKALEIANAAVELEPTLTRALEIKLDVLIARKQWPDVLAVMSELEASHDANFDLAKLRAEPRLAELVATPEFAKWLATRGQP